MIQVIQMPINNSAIVNRNPIILRNQYQSLDMSLRILGNQSYKIEKFYRGRTEILLESKINWVNFFFLEETNTPSPHPQPYLGFAPLPALHSRPRKWTKQPTACMPSMCPSLTLEGGPCPGLALWAASTCRGSHCMAHMWNQHL